MALKNILGGKPADKDAEVAKLREKFNSIVNSDANEKPGESMQPAPKEKPAVSQPASMPALPSQQYKMVEPERAEENERITNLIMQQIKELIEIDNNLNAKNKELENKISENVSTLASTKSMVEQFNNRLENIEKNMEKFMGLYEVVTNRFNPFVEEAVNSHQEPQAQSPASSGQSPPIKPQAATGTASPAAAQANPAAKARPQEVENKAHEIIEEAHIPKIAKEQEAIIEDELKKAVQEVGPIAAEQNKGELIKEVTELVKKEVQQAVSHHAKVNNEHLKTAMRDMLLESVKHIKESIPAAVQQQAPAQTAEPEEELHPDYHFYLPNGTPIKSVRGLKKALETMDDATFQTHVGSGKNDFADWLHVVLNDEALAQQVRQAGSRADVQKAIAHL